jgi:hypothetical protein
MDRTATRNAFAEFLGERAPIGTPVDAAFDRLRAEGFRCDSGLENVGAVSRPYNVCRKVVSWRILLARIWIASIEVGADRRVSGFRTNCVMDGP